MKLAELARKAAQLPDPKFEWSGPEQWHEDVFKRQVETLPQAIEYIKALRQRMGQYAMALHDLKEAYDAMKAVLLEFNVET